MREKEGEQGREGRLKDRDGAASKHTCVEGAESDKDGVKYFKDQLADEYMQIRTGAFLSFPWQTILYDAICGETCGCHGRRMHCV